MRRIWNAVRIFFRALFYAETAAWVQELLTTGRPALGGAAERAASATSVTPPPVSTAEPPAPGQVPRGTARREERPAAPQRSDAISLLAALQRDARFIDLVQESLDAYTDAQIGAAARDVLRDSRAVLDRMFAIRPVVDQAEGATVELTGQVDLHRYRLVGQVSPQGPYRGRLVHHGWEASQCSLPTWSGTREAAQVIAAAELEIPQ